MAELEMLLEQEIPTGRQSLIESHDNLKKVASYCAQRYLEDSNKKAALEDTKNYTTQALASIAYQINTLASNMLHMLDIQATQLADMDSSLNNISQIVDIHKEKVARREIGLLTTNKVIIKDRPFVPPANPERPIKYVRKQLDLDELDDLGHGIHLMSQIKAGNFQISPAVSTVSRSLGNPGDGEIKNDNIKSSIITHGTLRPVKAPTIPQDFMNSQVHGNALRTNSSSSIGSTGQPPMVLPPPPAMAYKTAPDPSSLEIPTHKGSFRLKHQSKTTPNIPLATPNIPLTYNTSYSVPNTSITARPSLSTNANSYAASSGSEISQKPRNIPIELDSLPPPPPPPDSVSMVSSGGGSSVHLFPTEPDWAPKNFLEKMIVIYDYSANNPDELNLLEDQIIYVVKRNDDGWYEGVLEGVTGLFPSNYAESVSS